MYKYITHLIQCDDKPFVVSGREGNEKMAVKFRVLFF